MATVAVQDFASHVKDYLAQVKAGQNVVITERGEAIARLVPVMGEADEDLEALAPLIASGAVNRPRQPRRQRVRHRIKVRGRPVSETIVEDRG